MVLGTSRQSALQSEVLSVVSSRCCTNLFCQEPIEQMFIGQPQNAGPKPLLGAREKQVVLSRFSVKGTRSDKSILKAKSRDFCAAILG